MIVDSPLFAEVYAISAQILWCTDNCDIDALMNHIAPDAIFKVGGTEAVGADAIRVAVTAATAVQGVTRHMLSNLRLVRSDADGVDVHSVVLVTLVQPTRQAVTTLDYADRFIRSNDGNLRLWRREMAVVSSLVL